MTKSRKKATPLAVAIFFLISPFTSEGTAAAGDQSPVYQPPAAQQQDAPFVMEEGMALLKEAQRKGDLEQAVSCAADILKYSGSQIDVAEVYLILGAMHLARRAIPDALNFYGLAVEKGTESEKRSAGKKIDAIADSLAEKDLSAMISKEANPLVRSRLMFQLGRRYLENYETSNALQVFSDFTRQYPDHKRYAEAIEKIDSIKGLSGYDGKSIGILLPLTGRYSLYGQKALRGIELAMNRHNATGTHALQIVLKDTGSEPSTAVSAVQALCEQNVATIIGPMVTSREAALEAQKSGVPIFVLTQEEEITGIGDFVFRNFITPGMQVDTLIDYAVERLGIRRFAVMYPDETYGQVFEKLFRNGVDAYGTKLVRSVAYTPRQTDFSEAIKALTKGAARLPANSSWDKDGSAPIDFEAVFIPDAPKAASLIAHQLLFYDIENILLIGTNLWYNPKLISVAGENFQNAIFVNGFLPESSQRTVQTFVSSFCETYNETPDYISAVAYDTAMIACETVSNPSVKSHLDLKKALKTIRFFDGVTGSTSIDDDGDVRKKPYLLQVREDEIVSLDEQVSIAIAEDQGKSITKVGRYNIVTEKDELLFETDMDGVWLIPLEDRIFFKAGEQGIYRILWDKEGRFIQIDNGRKIYIESGIPTGSEKSLFISY